MPRLQLGWSATTTWRTEMSVLNIPSVLDLLQQIAELTEKLAAAEDKAAMMEDVLRRASDSLGAFCADECWDQSDMDTMDAVNAALCAGQNAFVALQYLEPMLAKEFQAGRDEYKIAGYFQMHNGIYEAVTDTFKNDDGVVALFIHQLSKDAP
jgi:hypothetical protein